MSSSARWQRGREVADLATAAVIEMELKIRETPTAGGWCSRLRLVAGRYQWFVWPLYRAAPGQQARRGRLIVRADLVVGG